MRLPSEFIDAVVDKVDIVDVISEYVSLKKQGNKYVGLCPFHNEKTASFTVDGDKQLFYCFGCHVGGNVVGFLEKKENLTFMETMESLAKRVNMELPASGDKTEGFSRTVKASILEANKEAARYYFNKLYEPEGKPGLDYFVSRGLTENIIKRFGLGFAPDTRDGLYKYLKEKGYSDDILVLGGLARQNEYGIRDNFRNRVMFPIISPAGDILGFGGRVMDKSLPKYLNTNDTPVFNKRKNLYALNILKKNNSSRAIIGEGYMDVIALNMAGFGYGVASLGTAVTPEQVHLLKRYVKEVYVCYDGDKAGISATHKVIDLMKEEGIKPKIIELPIGVDPDEYIKANGAEAFADMMRAARTSIEYLLDEIKAECDMDSAEGRADFATRGTKIVEKYAFDAIETEMYLKRIHNESGFSMDALYGNLEGKKENISREAQAAKSLLNKFDSATERALISVLIEHPELLSEAASSVKDEWFVNKAYLTVFSFLKKSGKKIGLDKLMLEFVEDSDIQDALSAVGIETTVFGEPASYMRDCLLKMQVEYLRSCRDALTEKLKGQFTAEEKISFAGEIAELDKQIKTLLAKL